MTIDKDTDTLMREWNDHLQKSKQKPLALFHIAENGSISLTRTNEVTNEHVIDMCERIIAVYKQK